MEERYVAFDVETPNAQNRRMSAIGVSVIERSEIVQVLQQGQEVLTSTWFIVTATILLVLAAAYAILAILMNRKNKKDAFVRIFSYKHVLVFNHRNIIIQH